MQVNIMSNNLKDKLETIQKYKIFFGHRSVGSSILKGIVHINSEIDDINFKIIDIEEIDHNANSFFAHSLIGKNGEPQTKCDDFSKIVNNKFPNGLDIAFFKFCFADFKKDSDVMKEFEYYKKMYDDIHKKNPNLAIIHLTVPLKSGSQGIKKHIKRIINIEDWSDADNIKRNEFNSLLLAEYDVDGIFDLAKIQSTYTDGSRESFKKNGNVYYALIADLTTDGGHLNQRGGNLLARELILFLSDYISKKFES